MSVRVSPISKTAAILIIAVGVFVLLAGLSTGEVASEVSGVAFIVLGVALYLLLLRFTRSLRRQIEEIEGGQGAGAWIDLNLGLRFLSHSRAERKPPMTPLMTPQMTIGA